MMLDWCVAYLYQNDPGKIALLLSQSKRIGPGDHTFYSYNAEYHCIFAKRTCLVSSLNLSYIMEALTQQLDQYR